MIREFLSITPKSFSSSIMAGTVFIIIVFYIFARAVYSFAL